MKKLKENWLTYLLVIVVVITGYIGLLNTGTSELRNKVKQIEKLNDSLSDKNDFYESQRDSIAIELIKRQKQIETIECLEKELIVKVLAIDKKINDIII